MDTATITRTKTHIVIKIPIIKLAAVRRASIDSHEKGAVADGLRAVTQGHMSKPLKTKREVLSFLRKL